MEEVRLLQCEIPAAFFDKNTLITQSNRNFNTKSHNLMRSNRLSGQKSAFERNYSVKAIRETVRNRTIQLNLFRQRGTAIKNNMRIMSEKRLKLYTGL